MTATPPFDISSLKIANPDSKACLRDFSCGETEIDHWAREKSFDLHQKHRSRVFCAFLPGNNQAIGFYALNLSSEKSKYLFGQDKDYYKAGHAPFIYLSYIAVRRTLHDNGIGTILLLNALQRAYSISFHLPFYGVALRSLNGKARGIYERRGFVAREETTHPIMILPIFTLIDLFAPR